MRHRTAEIGHPVQDLAAEDSLARLPGWAPASQATAEDRLVPEEGVLYPRLPMVPRLLLPPPPSERRDARDRSIPSGRPQAASMAVRPFVAPTTQARELVGL